MPGYTLATTWTVPTTRPSQRSARPSQDQGFGVLTEIDVRAT